jgi:hypothetical protein
LITSATLPRQEEIRRRQRRYVVSMLFRALCFVLAVVVFDGLARFVAVVVAVILPWVAVIVANGGPPPEKSRPSLLAERAPAAEPAPRPVEPGRHPVVDGEVGEPSSPPPPDSPHSPP